MKLKLTITLAPGETPIEVNTNLLCVAEWERSENRKVSDGLGIGISDLAWWSHYLLKLGGHTKAATWREWLEQHPDVDIQAKDVTPLNPTDGEPTDVS
jgi:hypothetical protein